MKTANLIKSMVFLFAILFSFCVSAYNSLNKTSSDNNQSFHSTQFHQSSKDGCVSDTVLFEEQELEDDTEDCSPTAFFILPYLFSSVGNITGERPVLNHTPVACNAKPLFISIRVLRI